MNKTLQSIVRRKLGTQHQMIVMRGETVAQESAQAFYNDVMRRCGKGILPHVALRAAADRFKLKIKH